MDETSYYIQFGWHHDTESANDVEFIRSSALTLMEMNMEIQNEDRPPTPAAVRRDFARQSNNRFISDVRSTGRSHRTLTRSTWNVWETYFAPMWRENFWNVTVVQNEDSDMISVSILPQDMS